ncbi:MAG TPA: DUF1361 domain-containing protein [Roseiflexaceae bacterium]|nr:DUF1361 domain-containing protein [Roseiflexaceae bacterium]
MIARLIREWHQFLAERSFYALALASATALAALAGRMQLSGSHGYRFLVWNLFLAWVPYLLALWADAVYRRAPQRWSLPAALGTLWLLFFPNAPYIVTDFVHLHPQRGFAWWYDLGLLALFAWSGLFLGLASLEVMQRMVRAVLGRAASWLFVLAAGALGGLGVYLGRFLRWNSWDALVAPHDILASLAEVLADPRSLRQATGISTLFAALLLISYVVFVRQSFVVVKAKG